MSRGPRKHPWGCTCQSHVGRPWNRPEHWSQAECDYLDAHYGLMADVALARKLGRTVVGIRLKAKRLGLHKRDQGITGRGLAEIFGTDSSTIGKVWIRGGLLRSTRTFRQGPYFCHLVAEADVERFIREHPERIDVDKMPDSPYRDLAAQDPWISLPELHRRTGRDPHAVAQLIKAGVVRGRRRGAHWYMPVADLPKVPPLRSQDAIEESAFRRGSRLEMRRNRRKGSIPRLGSGRSALSAVQRVAS